MDLNLDNSAISTLHCKRKFQLTVIEGLVSPIPDKSLEFGNAVHKTLEFLDKGDDLETALTKASTHEADPFALRKTTTLYSASRKMPPPLMLKDNTPAVEVKFRYHYGRFLADNKAVEVYLSGTIDRIYIEDNRLVIKDYKTSAAATDYQQDKTKQSYALSFQLPFYTYALLKSGILPAEYESLIIERKYKTVIDMLFYNVNPPKFTQLISPAYPDFFLHQEVPYIINTKVAEAIKVAQLKNEPAPHDGMTVYKACEYCDFRPACLHMGEAREQEYLERFNRRVYDPLTFR